MNRKKNTARGTAFGLVVRVIRTVFPFFIRAIFIRTLGADYLGVNSLFRSVLDVLNMAELGVSSAIMYSMYRPIAEHDTEKICSLMNLFRRYYYVIGLVILGIGHLLIPFLPSLIRDPVPDDINLTVIYLMYLGTNVLSYWLFSYRNILFIAHQRFDIASIVKAIVITGQYSLQIVVLLVFKNYYLFLALYLLSQITINLGTAAVSGKFYPDYRPRGEVSGVEKKEINGKVVDLFTLKIADAVNNSSNQVIVSAFLGLSTLVVFSNYGTVIGGIMSIFSVFFSSTIGGVGNYLVTRGKDDNKQLFYNINHVVMLALAVCCSCFICVCRPFMSLWMGSEFTMGMDYTILFALYLFSQEAQLALLLFKDAGGMWKKDKVRTLVITGMNLGLSIILSQVIGLYGVLISTVFSLLVIGLPWLARNVEEGLLSIDIHRFILKTAVYVLVTVLCCTVSYMASCQVVPGHAVTEILVKLLIAAAISSSLFVLCFWRSGENVYLLKQLRRAVTKKVINRF